MPAALPIIFAGPTGEASRIVTETNAGVLVRPEDPEALANAVRQIADDAEFRSRLAQHSQAAASSYSRETQASHMLRVLEAVVSGNGNKAGSIMPDTSKPS